MTADTHEWQERPWWIRAEFREKSQPRSGRVRVLHGGINLALACSDRGAVMR